MQHIERTQTPQPKPSACLLSLPRRVATAASCRAAQAVPDWAVLPLILQPLVENAIRHGIEPLPQGGEVRTEVRREGDDVLVRVVDDGVAAEPEPTARASVGLRGVRVRLEHLYGTRARCEVSTAPGRGYAVMLCLPIPVA